MTYDVVAQLLQCDALRDAGLGDRLLFPTDTDYEPRINSYWAINARLRPFCLVLPRSTEEVSTALTALVDVDDGAGDWHIAVRSGGRSLTGSNNIINGVTIDLTMMNSTSYDPDTNLAKIQPGGYWMNTYASLDKLGVTVAGGRDGSVGVGGFLLGGGNSYYSGKMGFGCDSVVSYEVVLANGTVVNANESYNVDLWRALKGGSSNFGIVTRFDMEAMPTQDLYQEIVTLGPNYTDALFYSLVGFSNQDESMGENALVSYLIYNTTVFPEIAATAIYVNTQGKSNETTAFDDLKNLPAIDRTAVRQSMAKAASGSQVPSGDRFVPARMQQPLTTSTNHYIHRASRSTLLFRNDPQILRRAAELHEEWVETLKQAIDPDSFATRIFLQPIPSYMAQISKRRGGNMLGLDKVHDNAIMWTAFLAVDEELGEVPHALGQAEMRKMTAKLKEFTESVQGDLGFLFLNYADVTQDTLGSYGVENVQHMRDVAAKYDPTGVFQNRIPGGFKISRAA